MEKKLSVWKQKNDRLTLYLWHRRMSDRAKSSVDVEESDRRKESVIILKMIILKEHMKRSFRDLWNKSGESIRIRI